MPSTNSTRAGDAFVPQTDTHSITESTLNRSRLRSRRAPRLWKWFASGAALLLAGRATATLTVSPPSVSNTFNGVITLTITNLNNVQTVIVEKFFDANNNGTIGSADLLMQQFKVTDGQVTNLAGRRNLNVPGDDDGSGTANGSILTKLYFTPDEIPARLDGQYIFRVSPDGGAGFSPFTNTLTVTQQIYSGSGFTGKVTVGATGQSGAFLLITAGSSNDFDVRAVTKTDGSGNYSINLPPGLYRPVAAKSGYVFNVGTAPLVTVNAGSTASSANAVLTARTRTIAGALRDDTAAHATVPGALVFAQTDNGMFSFTFTDASGSFTLDAAAGTSEVGTLEGALALHGIIRRDGFTEGSAGNVTGFNLDMPRATSLIYGTVRTPASAAVPFIDVRGDTDNDPELQTSAITDLNGNYTLGVTSENWQVESESPGYLFPQENVNVSAAGLAVLHNITAYPITTHLRGQVRDNHNNPVGNLELNASDFQGSDSRGFTDPGGFFDIGVYGGPGGTAKTWHLQLNQDRDNPSNYISTNAEFQVVDGMDRNGINYVVYAVTAHLRGQVLDENSAPVGNGNVYASLQSGSANTGSDVESDGSFDIGVFGGTWSIGLSNDSGSGLLAQNDSQVTVADNVDQNGLILRIRHTNGTISGTVKNTQGVGLGGIRVGADATVAGLNFSNSAVTDVSGNYSLQVFSATWNVSPNGFGPEGLENLGYQPVASQNVTTGAGNTTVNFVASTGGQTYASWQTTKFTPAEAADPNQGGPNADFEKDGIVNLMEYALHLEPKIRDAGGLPAVGYQPPVGPAAAFLTLTFTRLTGSSGLAYNVQESPALNQSWTNVAASYEVLSSDGVTESVRAKTPVGPGEKFLRLQVVQSGP